MRIVHDKTGEYPDALNNYYFYNNFNDCSTKEILFQGYNTSLNIELKDKYKNFERKIYLNLEAPTAFTSTRTAISSQEYFDEIYTLCPYTSAWLNKNKTKYYTIPFPINISFLESKCELQEKYIDVMYQGNITNTEQENIISMLPEFKYIFTTLQQHPYSTHYNISTIEKWNWLKKSKTNVIINACPINENHKYYIQSYNDWKSNYAFSNLESGYIPQFKSRVVEAAACKTLNLIKLDQWNVMELWFEPGKEFIYWKTLDELHDIIKDVTNNFDKYKIIIDNAYNKVLNYDSTILFEKIRKGILK